MTYRYISLLIIYFVTFQMAVASSGDIGGKRTYEIAELAYPKAANLNIQNNITSYIKAYKASENPIHYFFCKTIAEAQTVAAQQTLKSGEQYVLQSVEKIGDAQVSLFTQIKKNINLYFNNIERPIIIDIPDNYLSYYIRLYCTNCSSITFYALPLFLATLPRITQGQQELNFELHLNHSTVNFEMPVKMLALYMQKNSKFTSAHPVGNAAVTIEDHESSCNFTSPSLVQYRGKRIGASVRISAPVILCFNKPVLNKFIKDQKDTIILENLPHKTNQQIASINYALCMNCINNIPYQLNLHVSTSLANTKQLTGPLTTKSYYSSDIFLGKDKENNIYIYQDDTQQSTTNNQVSFEITYPMLFTEQRRPLTLNNFDVITIGFMRKLSAEKKEKFIQYMELSDTEPITIRIGETLNKNVTVLNHLDINNRCRLPLKILYKDEVHILSSQDPLILPTQN